MEESGSNSSLSSVRDEESIYINYGFSLSKQSDGDCFLSIFPGVDVSPCRLAGFETSLDRLFACRYHYREGKAMKTTQIGKLKFCAWGCWWYECMCVRCRLIYKHAYSCYMYIAIIWNKNANDRVIYIIIIQDIGSDCPFVVKKSRRWCSLLIGWNVMFILNIPALLCKLLCVPYGCTFSILTGGICSMQSHHQ